MSVDKKDIKDDINKSKVLFLKNSENCVNNTIEMNTNQKKNKKKIKNNKKRCHICNKKMGLIPFNCKCDNQFCTLCRYPETHNCTYDWKKEGIDKLIKENPKVIGKKVDWIE